MTGPSFKTKTGAGLPAVSSSDFEQMLAALQNEYGISPAQMCEAASFSHAMVVRYALGLSAEGGRVGALIQDCLSGWIALATLRHLVNAGTEVCVIYPGGHTTASPMLELQERPLKAMGIKLHDWTNDAQNDEFSAMILSCHNLLCGLYQPSSTCPDYMAAIIDGLNEIKTPVHTIQAPLGVDVDTGEAKGTPLYASSTLSLGLPFRGLHNGSDYVGRHYACDISLPRDLLLRFGLDYKTIFAEQPVMQIFPIKDEG